MSPTHDTSLVLCSASSHSSWPPLSSCSVPSLSLVRDSPLKRRYWHRSSSQSDGGSSGHCSRCSCSGSSSAYGVSSVALHRGLRIPPSLHHSSAVHSAARSSGRSSSDSWLHLLLPVHLGRWPSRDAHHLSKSHWSPVSVDRSASSSHCLRSDRSSSRVAWDSHSSSQVSSRFGSLSRGPSWPWSQALTQALSQRVDED